MVLTTLGATSWAQDCNGTISDDLADIRSGYSRDCNGNDIPDECELVPTLRTLGALVLPGDRIHIFSLAAADWNGDTRLDLAALDFETGDVHILIHSGGALGFEAAPPVATGLDREVIAAGDLNGDGPADLAVSNRRTQEVWIFAGNGDGTFTPGPRSPIQGEVEDLSLHDIDDDRDLDFVIADRSTLKLRLYLNDGSGRVVAGQVFDVGFPPEGSPLADLDTDGDMDIIVTSGDTSRVAENDSGQWRLRALQIVPGGEQARVIDVDVDGRPDFISRRQSGLSCVRGLHGLTLAKQALLIRSYSLNFALTTGDFNADGTVDIAASVSSTDGKHIAFLSLDQPPPTADIDGNGVPDLCDPIPSDCDGDRVTDVDELAQGTETDCNNNTVPDTCDLTARAEFPRGGSAKAGFGPRAVISADLDGDSNMDLATADTDSDAFSFLRNDGAENLVRTSYRVITNGPNAEFPSRPSGIAAADLDGDGRLDLATANESEIHVEERFGTVSVFWGMESGRFQSGGYLKVTSGSYSIRAADFDGDGLADLVVSHPTAFAVSVIGALGARRFLPPVAYNVESTPRELAAVDLNGDDVVDVAVACQLHVQTLLNRGDGALQAGPTTAIPAMQFATTAIDLDEDGDQDLIGSENDAGRLQVLRNAGDGRFRLDAERPIEVLPTGLAVLDADQDGRLDLAVATGTWNFLFPASVAVRLNTGRGTLGAGAHFLVPGMPRAVAASDLDGDGRTDLANVSENQLSEGGDRSAFVSVLLNRTVSTSRDCNGNGSPDECDIALGSSNDINQNAIPDGCEPDCDRDGIPDDFQLSRGEASDCDQNGELDTCDIASGRAVDCNRNGMPDACDTRESSRDCDANTIPDECQLDCNSNGIADACDLTSGASADCNRNAVPDECDLSPPSALDCDESGNIDSCEIAASPALDCDANGTLDGCDLRADPGRDRDGDGRLDACTVLSFRRGDCNGDGKIVGSVTDALFLLLFNFLGGPAPPCLAACDVDGDGDVLGSVTDPVYLLQFNFLGGPPPLPPFPQCGHLSEDTDLGCGEYTKC